MNLTLMILVRSTHGTLRILPLYKSQLHSTIRCISHSKYIFQAQNTDPNKDLINKSVEGETMKQLTKRSEGGLSYDNLRIDAKNYYDRSKMYLNNLYSDLYSKYEATFGLNMIQEYHNNLQQIERSILDAYERRREIQNNLNEVQAKIKDIKFEMEKFPRNSDHYITLFTKEHKLLKHEDNLGSELKKEEDIERQLLTSFSENVRKSYQIELARRNKQQFVSYIYYIISSSLAISCYFLGRRNFHHRYEDKMSEISKSTMENSAALSEFFKENMKTIIEKYTSSFDAISQKISKIESEMSSMKNTQIIIPEKSGAESKDGLSNMAIQTYGPYILCALCGYVLWRLFS